MKTNANFINSIKVEGYVYGTGSNFNQLAERVTGETSKNPGTKYISGDLEIATDEAGLNIVTVHYSYVTQTYKSGANNKTYTALKKIIDNPDKTWLNGGKDNALKVQCSGGSIAVNDFIGSDGNKVAVLRNENGFCNIVTELNSKEEERSVFSVDMLITKVAHIEADPDKGIKNDYATVSGCVFGYGPKIIPASFTIRNPGGIEYFENLDVSPSNPTFTKVWGKITSHTEKIERKEESAFGEAAIQVFERKNKEYCITGTAKIVYDFGDEEVLTTEDVVKMNQERQVMLAEIEEKYKERQLTKASGGNGFNAAAQIPEGGFVF